MDEKKRNLRKNLVCAAVCALFAVLAVWLLGRLTEPKYSSGVLEGGMTAEYYDETAAHDVIFVGDCEVYENFSPVTLWEKYGITSYIRGSAQQLVWQSYWLLAEAFSRESPKVVVYNVQAMKYSGPQSEAYNRMTIDGMPLSKYKLGAIKASMTDEESLITYLVPFLRYHSRWSELTKEDVEYMFSHRQVTVAGYLMRADTKPMTRLPSAPLLDDYSISDVCFGYLGRMAELCRENGAELVLIKSPCPYPHWYEEWDEQIAAWAAENGVDYINMLEASDEIGLDMQTDTYDGGLHLNVYGAEKLSDWFGEILSREYSVPDRSGEEAASMVWAEKTKAYDELKAAQLGELEEYGYLKSWTLGDKTDK